MGIALGLVLIAAAVLWIIKQIRNHKNGGKTTFTQVEMEARAQQIALEKERKNIAAGEQTVDYWKKIQLEIARQANEELLENYLLPFFDERFNRIELILQGDKVMPFARAEWLEARKRKLLRD